MVLVTRRHPRRRPRLSLRPYSHALHHQLSCQRDRIVQSTCKQCHFRSSSGPSYIDITTGRRPDPRQSGRVDPIPGWGNHGGPLHGLAGAPTVENFIEIASTESEVSGVGRYMYGTSGVHRSRYPWFGPVWTRVDLWRCLFISVRGSFVFIDIADVVERHSSFCRILSFTPLLEGFSTR